MRKPPAAEPTVAFVSLDTSGGGAERVAQLTVRALSSQRAGFFGLLSVRGKRQEFDCDAGFTMTGIAPTWPKPVALAQYALIARRIARQFGVTCLVTNSFGLNRVTLLLKRLRVLKTSVIVVEHNTFSAKLNGLYSGRVKRFAISRVTRWLYGSADAIIGVSDGVSRDLERALGLPTGSVTTIYNPVDIKQISKCIDGPVPAVLARAFNALPRPVVITTGRLVRAKAHQDLLKAFAALPDSQRGSLVVLGNGPLREDLERQANVLQISARVWMPGFVDNPWWFMARSDVFALSSHWEGFGLVLVEAMACGIPVVSTDCPSGPREILANEPSARLTPVGDTNALTQAIRQLLNHHKAPKIDFSSYDPDEVAPKYLAVIDSVHRESLR